jgi:hypothetical protein
VFGRPITPHDRSVSHYVCSPLLSSPGRSLVWSPCEQHADQEEAKHHQPAHFPLLVVPTPPTLFLPTPWMPSSQPQQWPGPWNFLDLLLSRVSKEGESRGMGSRLPSCAPMGLRVAGLMVDEPNRQDLVRH